jgi:hypothetical protein
LARAQGVLGLIHIAGEWAGSIGVILTDGHEDIAPFLCGSDLFGDEGVLHVFPDVDVAVLEGTAAFVDYVGGDLGQRDEVRICGVVGVDCGLLECSKGCLMGDGPYLEDRCSLRNRLWR